MEDDLKRTLIYRPLTQPNQLFGADRRLVLVTGLVSVILFLMSLTIYGALIGGALIGLLFCSLVVGLLRVIAKADPLGHSVYLRYISYRNEYRALPTPFKNPVKYGRA